MRLGSPLQHWSLASERDSENIWFACIQYVFRVSRGKIPEDARRRRALRQKFWFVHNKVSAQTAPVLAPQEKCECHTHTHTHSHIHTLSHTHTHLKNLKNRTFSIYIYS